MKRSTQRRRAMTILFSLFCSGFPSSIYKRTTVQYSTLSITNIYEYIRTYPYEVLQSCNTYEPGTYNILNRTQ